MIKVINEITLVESDGKEIPVGHKEKLLVESHWNMSKCVVIKVGDVNITVLAADLKSAIDNATNTNKYNY